MLVALALRMPLLDPTLDIVFKLLFTQPGTDEVLISLLTAVLRPPIPIASVHVLNPELDKDMVDERGVVLDLRVRLHDGHIINVEMQAQPKPAMPNRVLYQWARLYGSELVRGQDFVALQPCTVIFFLGFEPLHWPRFHSTFRVLEVSAHEPLSDQLEVHIVQLLRQPAPGSSGRGALANWAAFLTASDEQQLREAAMSDPAIKKAAEVLERLSADPEVQRRAREREEALLLYRMELHEARRDASAEAEARGRAEGKAEGKAEGLAEALLHILRARGWVVTEQARERILACGDKQQLGAWLRAAISAASVDELLG